MPPTTPAMSVVADTREQAELPCSSTASGAADGQRPGKRNARTFLARRRSRRVDGTSGYYDPLFGRPDLVENDYYRLRNHPGD